MLSEGPEIEPDKYRRHSVALRFAELPARLSYHHPRQNQSRKSAKPANFRNYSASAIAGAGRVR